MHQSTIEHGRKKNAQNSMMEDIMSRHPPADKQPIATALQLAEPASSCKKLKQEHEQATHLGNMDTKLTEIPAAQYHAVGHSNPMARKTSSNSRVRSHGCKQENTTQPLGQDEVDSPPIKKQRVASAPNPNSHLKPASCPEDTSKQTLPQNQPEVIDLMSDSDDDASRAKPASQQGTRQLTLKQESPHRTPKASPASVRKRTRRPKHPTKQHVIDRLEITTTFTAYANTGDGLDTQALQTRRNLIDEANSLAIVEHKQPPHIKPPRPQPKRAATSAFYGGIPHPLDGPQFGIGNTYKTTAKEVAHERFLIRSKTAPSTTGNTNVEAAALPALQSHLSGGLNYSSAACSSMNGSDSGNDVVQQSPKTLHATDPVAMKLFLEAIYPLGQPIHVLGLRMSPVCSSAFKAIVQATYSNMKAKKQSMTHGTARQLLSPLVYVPDHAIKDIIDPITGRMLGQLQGKQGEQRVEQTCKNVKDQILNMILTATAEKLNKSREELTPHDVMFNIPEDLPCDTRLHQYTVKNDDPRVGLHGELGVYASQKIEAARVLGAYAGYHMCGLEYDSFHTNPPSVLISNMLKILEEMPDDGQVELPGPLTELLACLHYMKPRSAEEMLQQLLECCTELSAGPGDDGKGNKGNNNGNKGKNGKANKKGKGKSQAQLHAVARVEDVTRILADCRVKELLDSGQFDVPPELHHDPDVLREWQNLNTAMWSLKCDSYGADAEQDANPGKDEQSLVDTLKKLDPNAADMLEQNGTLTTTAVPYHQNCMASINDPAVVIPSRNMHRDELAKYKEAQAEANCFQIVVSIFGWPFLFLLTRKTMLESTDASYSYGIQYWKTVCTQRDNLATAQRCFNLQVDVKIKECLAQAEVSSGPVALLTYGNSPQHGMADACQAGHHAVPHGMDDQIVIECSADPSSQAEAMDTLQGEHLPGENDARISRCDSASPPGHLVPMEERAQDTSYMQQPSMPPFSQSQLHPIQLQQQQQQLSDAEQHTLAHGSNYMPLGTFANNPSQPWTNTTHPLFPIPSIHDPMAVATHGFNMVQPQGCGYAAGMHCNVPQFGMSAANVTNQAVDNVWEETLKDWQS